MGGKVVALQAEGTGPKLGPEVDLAEGVEDGGAALPAAAYGVVREGRWGVGYLLQGRVEGGDGGDDAGGFKPRGRPVVPSQSAVAEWKV